MIFHKFCIRFKFDNIQNIMIRFGDDIFQKLYFDHTIAIERKSDIF